MVIGKRFGGKSSSSPLNGRRARMETGGCDTLGCLLWVLDRSMDRIYEDDDDDDFELGGESGFAGILLGGHLMGELEIVLH